MCLEQILDEIVVPTWHGIDQFLRKSTANYTGYKKGINMAQMVQKV